MAHISYSEFKIWTECPYKHKLKYIDRVNAFEGNEYTAFGTAIHSACEHGIVDDTIDMQAHFEKAFLQEIQKLPTKVKDSLEQHTIDQMMNQGRELALQAIPTLKEYFGNDVEVLSVEERLNESVNIPDRYNFKGFVDLVIKSGDKIHILDWKTCSWGWDARKKSDKITTYQLTFYKHYFAKKYDVDAKDIETYFALLKRTAKENKVEIFRVTSGPIKTQNALKMLENSIQNITSKNYVKNKVSCTSGYGCEFYKTEHCK